MKHKHSLVKLVLLLLLMLGTAFNARAYYYDFSVNDFYYSVDFQTGALYLTHYGGTATEVTIPATVTYGGHTFTVNAIADSAFYYNIKITKVTVPYTVTRIGVAAFEGCGRLSQVSFSGSLLRTIDKYAFFMCEGLSSITIPNGTTTIGDYAFGGCTVLTSATIPNTVTRIGTGAFYNCENLASVPWPQGTAAIPDHCFEGCKMLENFTFPAWVTSIGDYAFYNSGLGLANMAEGLTSIGEWAFADSKVTGAVIPSTVTTMGTYVFVDCSLLASAHWNAALADIPIGTFCACSGLEIFDFPYWIKSIGPSAFNGSGLGTAILPYGVEKVMGFAFQGCPNLNTLLIPSSVTSMNSDVFANCPHLAAVYCNMPYPVLNVNEVPDGCKVYVPAGKVPLYQFYWGLNGNKADKIEPGAFDFCYGTRYMPSSVYHMTVTSTTPVVVDGESYDGTAMYVYHPNIQSASAFSAGTFEIDNMSGSGKRYLITAIGDSAFYRSSLTSLNLGWCRQLTGIGQYAFWKSAIQSLTLPASVDTYDQFALSRMPKLTDLYINNPTPAAVPSTAFYLDDQQRATLHVPNQTAVNAYRAADCWKNFYSITRDQSSTAYDVWVCGVPVTQANKDHIAGAGITGTVTYNPVANRIGLENAHLTPTGTDAAIRFNTVEPATVRVSGSGNIIGYDDRAYDGIQSDNSTLCIEGGTANHADNRLEVYADYFPIFQGGNVEATRLANADIILNSRSPNAFYTTNLVPTLEIDNCCVQGTVSSMGIAGLNCPIASYEFLDLVNCHIADPVGGYWMTPQESGYICGGLFDSQGDLVADHFAIEADDAPAARGDVDGNGTVDPGDISALIDYLLNGTAVNMDNADCDLNGTVDPADISALIDYLLNGAWPAGIMVPALVKERNGTAAKPAAPSQPALLPNDKIS